MAYETGTANNLDDLLDKLRLFALANGWVVNKYVAPVNGTDSELYLTKGEVYANLEARLQTGNQVFHGVFQIIDRPYLRIYMSTGFDTNQAVDSQPQSSPGSESDWLLGPMQAYHFFSQGDYLYVVVEVLANEFNHFGFGQGTKIGTYTGGVFNLVTSWGQSTFAIDVPTSGTHRVPFDLVTNNTVKCAVLGSDVSGTFAWYGYASSTVAARALGILRSNFMGPVFEYTPNDFNGRTILQPIVLGHGMPGDLYTIIGHAPDIRYVNIKALSPGESITLGGDTWLTFPVVFKKDPAIRDDLPNSGYYGLAYRQVV